MKTMSCDMCDKEFSASSFDEWFGQMKNHYMSDHADPIAKSASKSKVPAAVASRDRFGGSRGRPGV